LSAAVPATVPTALSAAAHHFGAGTFDGRCWCAAAVAARCKHTADSTPPQSGIIASSFKFCWFCLIGAAFDGCPDFLFSTLLLNLKFNPAIVNSIEKV
jgi:hypothetical protein